MYSDLVIAVFFVSFCNLQLEVHGSPIICLNGGIIFNNKCLCDKEFMGIRCEQKVPGLRTYTTLQCLNGGKSSFGVCECIPGFYGDLCEYSISDARPKTTLQCLNGGKSSKDICECMPGFFGDLCEISISDARSKTSLQCLNGGKPSQDVCECMPGFFGDLCEYSSPGFRAKTTLQCLNGGWLTQGVCECIPGFYGHSCEYAITSMFESSPEEDYFQRDSDESELMKSMDNEEGCVNGIMLSSGHCKCIPGFSGTFCNDRMEYNSVTDELSVICGQSEIPDASEINSCIEYLSFQSCNFDTNKCKQDCSVFGYQKNKNGCIISCECSTEGLIEADIRYNRNDLGLINSLYRDPEAWRGASRTLLLWNMIREDDRVKIPYVIDDNMSDTHKKHIFEAILAFSNNTCLDFVPRVEWNYRHNDYVHFILGQGCWSYMGKIGGRQDISIGYGCQITGIVIHEMMHALGFWHEHSRPDRDDYVEIVFDNIREGNSHNFNKQTFATVNSLNSPYDVHSVMQYQGYAFSNGKPTIIDRFTNSPVKAQRQGFSKQDIEQINKLYKCPSKEKEVITVFWDKWSEWSECSTTCGEGEIRRERKCVDENFQVMNNSDCDGPAFETSDCNLRECADDDGWTPWSKWTECSSSCGLGFTWKYRYCTRGTPGFHCQGSEANGKYCKTKSCVTVTEDQNMFNWEPLQNGVPFCKDGEMIYGKYNDDHATDLLCFYKSSNLIEIVPSNADEGILYDNDKKTFSSSLCDDFKSFSLLSGDFNGDGFDDILCQDKETGRTKITFNDNGSFEDAASWVSSEKFAKFCLRDGDFLFAQDVNGDDFTDVVCRGRNSRLQALLTNPMYHWRASMKTVN